MRRANHFKHQWKSLQTSPFKCKSTRRSFGFALAASETCTVDAHLFLFSLYEKKNQSVNFAEQVEPMMTGTMESYREADGAPWEGVGLLPGRQLIAVARFY